eukprot:gene8251-7584_t
MAASGTATLGQPASVPANSACGVPGWSGPAAYGLDLYHYHTPLAAKRSWFPPACVLHPLRATARTVRSCSASLRWTWTLGLSPVVCSAGPGYRCPPPACQ